MQLIKKYTYYFLIILIMLVIVLMLLIHTFNHTEVSANEISNDNEEIIYPSGC